MFGCPFCPADFAFQAGNFFFFFFLLRDCGMEAADVAAFMMADDDEEIEVAAPPARPNPHYNAPPAAPDPKSRPVPRPPVKKAPSNAPPVKKAPSNAPSQGFTMRFEEKPVSIPVSAKPEDIRQMLMEEETLAPPAAPAPVLSRFEPLSSEIEVEAVRRTGGAAGARGGGFASVLVVGTEERAETMDETTRTFAAYRIECQREGGLGPYIIYRRFKQFETLRSRCRQHGMKVGKLPERRPGNWFGLKAVDPAVVAQRVPLLQSWLEDTIQLPQAAAFKFLQEWLTPVQLGDISEKKFAKIIAAAE